MFMVHNLAWNGRAVNYLTKEVEHAELHASLVSFEDETWLFRRAPPGILPDSKSACDAISHCPAPWSQLLFFFSIVHLTALPGHTGLYVGISMFILSFQGRPIQPVQLKKEDNSFCR